AKHAALARARSGGMASAGSGAQEWAASRKIHDRGKSTRARTASTRTLAPATGRRAARICEGEREARRGRRPPRISSTVSRRVSPPEGRSPPALGAGIGGGGRWAKDTTSSPTTVGAIDG